MKVESHVTDLGRQDGKRSTTRDLKTSLAQFEYKIGKTREGLDRFETVSSIP